jgi:hypothetical protein
MAAGIKLRRHPASAGVAPRLCSAYNAPVQLDALSQRELPDSTGTPHRLGSFWSERPTIVVFLRHFG